MGVFTTFKNNPVTVDYLDKNTLFNKLAPQGWAFFTKPPQNDHRLTAYIKKNSNLQLYPLKNVERENLFGLKKTNRILYHHISTSMTSIDNKHWFTTRNSLDSLDLSRLNVYKFKEFPLENNIDTLLLEVSKPIPWVWFSKLEYNKIRPKKRYILACIDEKDI